MDFLWELFERFTDMYDNRFRLSEYLLHDYVMFMHGFWRKWVDSEVLSFRNALLYSFIFISGFYFSFKRMFQSLYKKAKCRQASLVSQNIRIIWSTCFIMTQIIFLEMYHSQFISPEFERETRQLFPKFSNSLFFKVCDMKKFMLVTLILSSFYILEALIDLNERNFANSLSKFLFSAVLLTCYRQRLENYSVLLNIYVGLYGIIVHITHFFAINISTKRHTFLQINVIVRLLAWIFIYLNILPFDFLIPTINASAQKASLELNLLFWGWYIVRVWNSPFLKYFYHETYHINGDCVGDQSVYKCILLEDTPEQKYLRTMKRICVELKTIQKQKLLEKTLRSEETSSAKTFQTIKCIMALKRKLRRIRARDGTSNVCTSEKVSEDSDTEDDNATKT
ncbi:uncharacterized protein LOC134833159 [Culicoides brevitarsis]|uniref:uncharacterized protein LOC134833159 n=1 Tax=Culicoides brevitarsis TaxID=469753 RepID=UPI00307C43C8